MTLIWIYLQGGDDEKLRLASELSIKCSNFLKTMSQRYQVFLLGGGYPVPVGDGSHTFNRSALFGKDGQILAKYDKIHLFDVDLPDGNLYKESSTILSGACLLYTSPSPRDRQKSRMPSSA